MAEGKDSSEKASSPYKPDNVGPDGQYIVGKGRPPKHTRFAAGDGRKRGRRPKGQKNFDTEFQEEAKRKVTIREGGEERRVSKQRAAIIGDAREAVRLSDALAKRGIIASAIRPPTVPQGTSRLRLALRAAHSPRPPIRCRHPAD